MPAPLVSLVICVRDGEAWVAEAVSSALSQTVREVEVLVVDDGSRDGTPAVLRGLSDSRLVVLRHQTSLGPFASANAALERARGEFIARLDADDRCAPTRLEAQLAVFARRPSLALLGTAARRIDAAGGVLGRQRVPTGRDVALRCALDPPFVHSSVMWRASAGLRYAPELTVGGDFELWARALPALEADNLDEPLVDYREWQGSLSARRRDAQAAMHDAASWRFVTTRWPELAPLLPLHRALRRWAGGQAPERPDVEALVAALLERTGGARETLEAPLGRLGQPRVHGP